MSRQFEMCTSEHVRGEDDASVLRGTSRLLSFTLIISRPQRRRCTRPFPCPTFQEARRPSTLPVPDIFVQRRMDQTRCAAQPRKGGPARQADNRRVCAPTLPAQVSEPFTQPAQDVEMSDAARFGPHAGRLRQRSPFARQDADGDLPPIDILDPGAYIPPEDEEREIEDLDDDPVDWTEVGNPDIDDPDPFQTPPEQYGAFSSPDARPSHLLAIYAIASVAGTAARNGRVQGKHEHSIGCCFNKC